MPGINTPEWLRKQHFSNTSLVAREADGSPPVWQAQDVPWLLKSERDYLSIGEERGCQAPEVLWAVRSARKNEAIGNKFTWPSSASGGPAGEPLRAEALTPCLLPWDPRWGKKNAGRSLQGLSLRCADPPEVSASILLFYLRLLIISCEGVSHVQGQHLLKEREQTWSELPAEGPGWC